MDCHIWYSEEGSGWAAAPPSPLIAVPNVTVQPSTLYDSTWHCNYLWTLKSWRSEFRNNSAVRSCSIQSRLLSAFQFQQTPVEPDLPERHSRRLEQLHAAGNIIVVTVAPSDVIITWLADVCDGINKPRGARPKIQIICAPDVRNHVRTQTSYFRVLILLSTGRFLRLPLYVTPSA